MEVAKPVPEEVVAAQLDWVIVDRSEADKCTNDEAVAPLTEHIAEKRDYDDLMLGSFFDRNGAAAVSDLKDECAKAIEVSTTIVKRASEKRKDADRHHSPGSSGQLSPAAKSNKTPKSSKRHGGKKPITHANKENGPSNSSAIQSQHVRTLLLAEFKKSAAEEKSRTAAMLYGRNQMRRGNNNAGRTAACKNLRKQHKLQQPLAAGNYGSAAF